jgi:PAS domain S-box-containing protein
MSDVASLSQEDRDHLVQRFVDDLPDCALVVLDAVGTVLTWNAGARSLFGYRADEIVGRSFSYLCTPEELASALHAALRRGRHEATAGFAHKDGRRVTAQAVIFPLHDARENHRGYGALVHDFAGASRTTPEDHVADLAARRHSDRILVVDDDDGVRQVAVRQLTSLGYRVIDRSNGADALKTLAEMPDIALLFVDVVMPNGLGGKEVAQKAIAMRPDLKILFASGYFEGALAERGDVDRDVDFLVKPYRKKDLAEKVQQVLGSPTA